MSNPSKAIGTRAETRVARYLTKHGLPTERKALAGNKDKGDLRMTLPSGEEIALEVKAGAQTKSYPRSSWMSWAMQTNAEAHNSGCRCVLVIVKYNRRLADAEVWVPNWWFGHTGWTMWYMSDFVEWMKDLYEDEVSDATQDS